MSAAKIRVNEAALLIGASTTVVKRLWHAGLIEGEFGVNSSNMRALWLDLDSVLAYAADRARMARSRLALKQGRLGDAEFVDSDLLTTEEACALVGVTRQTLAAWIKLGFVENVSYTSGGNARIEFRDIPKLIKQKGKPRS